ncbi:flagellar hook-associated protein 2 [Eubacterium sp. CAG:76]|nr:flagellar hook-associated protein 2 [Eubacterium sp. CAG:76]
MPIRLSGMVSGMDTESLVTALVSGYQLKKDNLVKAQTKLSWKQEKWKTMNTSIYSFYSGKLSAARFSKAYSLKKSTVSNSSVATVTASSSAVAGDQTLKVKELASSGYLTGGEVTNKSDSASKITGSSKLSAITGKTSGQGSVTLSVDGKSTNIELTDDMTVNQFIVKLKDAGVQASFDEANQRFFISSKTSGKDGDFSLVANDTTGRESLYELGLYTDDKTSTAEYTKWAGYYNAADGTYTSALDDIINSAYESNKISFDTVAQEKLAAYSKASATVDSFNTKYMSDTGVTAEDNAKAQLAALISKGKGGDDNSDFDESKLTDKEKENYKTLKSDIDNYSTAKQSMEDLKDYVNIEVKDGKTTVSALKETDSAAGVANIAAETADRNAKIKADLTTQYQNKAKSSYDMINATHEFSKGASRKVGQDSEIELNGATFTSNSNNYSINGITIQVTAKTKDDEQVTITTDTDVDAIYKSIKDMFTEYNKLIKSMDEAYNADSSKGYEPLTDDEKSAMTDDEVEKWETKIKDSLLRKDDTLSSIINTMKNDMASSITINGKSYALSSFGIATQGYFASGENEKGVYHIDGDSDDSVTSGNDDKLRAAIAGDPETVVSFFSQLFSKVYTDLGNKMATSSVSSAYTVYNDKQMNKQYSEYTTKISDAETKITTWEDYYYSKFSAMESALSKLNSQTSSMSSLFGN